MATLSQVAKQAGVSITTVSLVLNRGKRAELISEACANHVRAVAQNLGYVANYHAQSMKLGRSEMIGVAMDWAAEPFGGLLASTYFGHIISAAEQSARHRGYLLTTLGPSEHHGAVSRGAQALAQRRLDGLIVLDVVSHERPNIFLKEPPDKPIVVIEHTGETEYPCVNWDQTSGVQMAVEHLSGLGHRDYLWLGEESHPRHQSRLREQQFMRTIWDLGFRGASCRFTVHSRPGMTEREPIVIAAQEALAKYLAEPGRATFTAIVCYNDATAIGAYRVLRGAGLRVPEDVSVVGFDDFEGRLIDPPLTSVNHMLEEMGHRAADLLIDAIESEPKRAAQRGLRELIRPQLSVRQSTGPAAGGVGAAEP